MHRNYSTNLSKYGHVREYCYIAGVGTEFMNNISMCSCAIVPGKELSVAAPLLKALLWVSKSSWLGVVLIG